MRDRNVVVVGAGIGGLVAGLELAAAGVPVTVVERASTPGGKMREVSIGGRRIDVGPTVFTMRWVFEEIFAHAGAYFADHVTLKPAGILARHAWGGPERFDLHADMARSAEAVGAFAGAAEARRFLEFCERARRIYQTLEGPFIRAARPSLQQLVRGAPVADLWRISPFTTLWSALGQHFHDPRLRQLFARYATYCGSSPFEAPATLMLVAHVEQQGVWLVEGGMHALAKALANLAEQRGAVLRYGCDAREIEVEHGRVVGVRLASGERFAADALVLNADVAALAGGRFGRAVTRAVPAPSPARRSLSAMTWAFVAEAEGFPLARHNVFFSDDYAREFDEIFKRQRPPSDPTVYLCAQDRGDGDGGPGGPERLFCLINAPPTGDTPTKDTETARCARATFRQMQRSGLNLTPAPKPMVATTPRDFERLFPGTGGALYGQASHGWTASFDRPGVQSRLPGLYLAGGSIHPGPGVPMAALSGRTAAACLLRDWGSSGPSRATATAGGTSTP